VPGGNGPVLLTEKPKSDCVMQAFSPEGGVPHRIFPSANVVSKISAEFLGGAPWIVTRVFAICRTSL
jgi:hypothetical protein